MTRRPPPTFKVLDPSVQVILPQELSPEVLGNMVFLDLVLGPLLDILGTLDRLGLPELHIKHTLIDRLQEFTTEVHVNKGILRVVLNHLKD